MITYNLQTSPVMKNARIMTIGIFALTGLRCCSGLFEHFQIVKISIPGRVRGSDDRRIQEDATGGNSFPPPSISASLHCLPCLTLFSCFFFFFEIIIPDYNYIYRVEPPPQRAASRPSPVVSSPTPLTGGTRFSFKFY